MGSNRGFPLEEPVHRVQFNRSFLIGAFPVTQRQWLRLMPGWCFAFPGEDSRPAESLSWDDAQEFCQKLGSLLQQHVRLPSEAEWEYSCRAGSITEYHFGANESLADYYGWHEDNAPESTSAIGIKKTNAWGIHDMTGNVWEWCEDVWHSDYLNSPTDGTPHIQDGSIQPRRCLRGGAFDMDAFRMRSAYRSFDFKDQRGASLGLRLVIDRTEI